MQAQIKPTITSLLPRSHSIVSICGMSHMKRNTYIQQDNSV